MCLRGLALVSPELDSLYQGMIYQIGESDSTEICPGVLIMTVASYRPATVVKLAVLLQRLKA